jgi:ATP-dependent helicase/nuclease subunit B
MSATAVISVAHRRRLGRARVWLESRGQSEELLVVGATLDGANELARAVAKEKGVAFGWHRVGFSQLAFAIAAPVLAGRGLVPLSRVGTEAIVAGLAHRLKTEGRLKHYEAVADAPGFPRAIAGVIAELRSARVRRDAVASVAPDLVTIIQAYERELADGNFCDWPSVLQLTTDAIGSPDRLRLIGLPTLLLDVPIATEAELAFVAALAAAAPAMLATIPTADAATLGRFRDLLGCKVEDLDQSPVAREPGASTGALARLQRHLFNEHEKPAEAEADNEIEVFSAPGEGRECVEIAAASIGPTKTLPYRCTGGGTAVSRSRLRRTMRTSFSSTGPTGAMGASSERIASTRSGCLRVRVAIVPSRSSHSPQHASAGRLSSSSMSGRA